LTNNTLNDKVGIVLLRLIVLRVSFLGEARMHIFFLALSFVFFAVGAILLLCRKSFKEDDHFDLSLSFGIIFIAIALGLSHAAGYSFRGTPMQATELNNYQVYEVLAEVEAKDKADSKLVILENRDTPEYDPYFYKVEQVPESSFVRVVKKEGKIVFEPFFPNHKKTTAKEKVP